MTTKKTTILMASVLAAATVLAAGLTVLPNSVQDAQANPCSNNVVNEDGDVTASVNSLGEQNCDFTGPVEFDED